MIIISIVAVVGYIIYDYYKLGGFDPETRKFRKRNSEMLVGEGSSKSGGGSFDGSGAGGSFGGEGGDD